ncbi:hypothetical protein K1X84_03825 [bacterium]|nr:hypothetical protein [bacterium]
MRHLRFLIIFHTILFFSQSCEERTEKAFNKNPSTDNLTREEANQYLEILSRQLSFGDHSLSKSKNGLLKTSTLHRFLKEDKMNIAEVMDGAEGRIKVDGKICRVNVEIFNAGAVEAFSKNLAFGEGDETLYGVYPDPANYYDGTSNEVTFPVHVVSSDEGSFASSDEFWTAPYAKDIDDIDDEFQAYIANLRATLTYPIFAVTMEEEDDPEENLARITVAKKRRELNKGLSSAYLTLHSIRLYVTRDGLTAEEFQSWYGRLDGVSRYKHNDNSGETTIDARGVPVKLEDINTDHKWYDQTTPFYYMYLSTGNNDGVVLPFEDDINEGSMDRSEDCFYIQDYGCIHSENWDEAWNAATGSVSKNVSLSYTIDNQQQSWVDTDDKYGEGALFNENQSNMHSRTGGGTEIADTKSYTDGGLDDMRWKIGYALY